MSRISSTAATRQIEKSNLTHSLIVKFYMFESCKEDMGHLFDSRSISRLYFYKLNGAFMLKHHFAN